MSMKCQEPDKNGDLLSGLRERNSGRIIHRIGDDTFSAYGRPLALPGREELIRWADGAVRAEGPVYVARYDCWKGSSLKKKLEDLLYGSFPVQIGSCCGMNSRMNGMEYHKGHEVVLALTPLVLFLGHLKDIRQNRWDAQLAEAFFLDRGEAAELYSTTLHLAPCRVDSRPFRSLIILPEGTNYPLDFPVPEEEPLLYMTNKWMICHPDSPAAGRGVHPGILGENIGIAPV